MTTTSDSCVLADLGADLLVGRSVSRPTTRVVAIVGHLASHPDRAFGLSELARDLEMTKSTCLAVLTTLTEAGYLIQHPGRRDYRLGPALIGAARAATQRLPDLRAARLVVKEVADSLGVAVNVVAVADDQLVVLDSFGGEDAQRGFARVGTRVPFHPPYGAGFVAWGDSPAWDRWISHSPVPLNGGGVERLRASVETGRQRGFLVALEAAEGHPIHHALRQWRTEMRGLNLTQFAELSAARLADAGYLVDGIESEATYSVSMLHAPVLPQHGAVPLGLVAVYFGRVMSGDEVTRAGHRLAAAARRAGSELSTS